MRAVDIIRKKRDGGALERDEIEVFVKGVTARSWPEYQAAALLMAIVLRGMSSAETAWLTDAMVRSGVKLDLSDLPGPKVDKHSTGGVGDKTSLILAPLVAACGAIVPMMAGRGLGHTGGTLDKLEAIPGFRVGLTLPEFTTALRQVGCALIGQTEEIAPADKILYALRDLTATVESIPLISASIMSKKISEGIGALVLDIKCGRGAFMKDREKAGDLAKSLVSIGKAHGILTQAVLTGMDVPLGQAVGNALEVIECLETLKGRGPADVKELSLFLAARMVLLAGVASDISEAQTRVQEALDSGRGLEKLSQIVAQQGGDHRVIDDYSRLPAAPRRFLVRADRSGCVHSVDAELVGRATGLLGAGRQRVEDVIDPGVGALVLVRPGAEVRAGHPLLELFYREESRLRDALPLAERAFAVADQPPAAQPLILDIVT